MSQIPLTFLRSISGYGDTGYGTTGYFSNIVIAGDATIAGEDASTTTLTPSNIILGCTTGAGYTNTLTPFSSEIADNNSLYTVRTIYNSITLTNNEGIPSSLRITAKSISADYWQIHPQGGIVATNLQLYNYSGGERVYFSNVAGNIQLRTEGGQQTVFNCGANTPLIVAENNITASVPITGSLNGNASSASTVALTANDNTDGTYFIPFSKSFGATSNALFIDNILGPLTYNPSTSVLTALIFNGATQKKAHIVSSGSTAINFALGSLIIDDNNTTTATAYTLPALTTASTGFEFTVQKTALGKHDTVLSPGTENSFATSINDNTTTTSFIIADNILQQSFRFIHPTWYPF